MTQAELGEYIGKTGTAIVKYENGQRNINRSVLLTLHTKLNLNSDWLKTGIGEMFSENITQEDIYSIPLYDYTQGYEAFLKGTSVTGNVKLKTDPINYGFPHPQNLVMFKMQDISMSPELEKGDMLAVDKTDLREEDGALYLCSLGDRLYIRKIAFNKPFAVLMTPKGSSMAVNEADFTILGKVIWYGRFIK